MSAGKLVTMSEKRCYYVLLVFASALLAIAGSKQQSDDGQQVLLENKVSMLTEWSAQKSVIHLTSDHFKTYLKTAPRNYSVVVMFTALKRERQCGICGPTKEEFDIIANSWKSSRHFSSSLFFALLDYDSAPDIFQSMKIQSVPVFMHFPAKGKRKKADTTDLRSVDMAAEEIAKWVRDRTQIEIKVLRPVNNALLVTVIASCVVVCGVLFFLRKKLHWIFNTTSGGVVALMVIFAMISGYMWNRIRKPPNMHTDHRTGQPLYIHPNRGSQFVMETYIIMFLYGAMVVGFIMMNEIGTLKRRWSKMFLALAGLACVLFFFALLLNTFKEKSPYYPYGVYDLLNYVKW